MPHQYQTQHLFLLVGENPLPNYVAAKTLLQEGGTVYLVFTNQTINQKNCLQRELNGIETELVELGDQESDACKIREEIQKKINRIPTQESIGLNYTGGTKAMAVHAYQAVQELRSDAIFSYLDARTLKMCIDQTNNKPILIDIDLQLSLEKLFNLHDLYLLKNFPPSSQPILPELAKEILEIYKTPVKDDSGKTKYLDKDFKNWCGNIGNKAKIPQSSQFAETLKEYLELPDDRVQITQKTKDAGFEQYDGRKSDIPFRTWLEGLWLESYVLQAIQERAKKLSLKSEDCQMSFNVTDNFKKAKIAEKKTDDSKFELDVAFIKGYQLFALSCTTKSKKPDCKEKLFEAYLRAKQLGGDEARVALISCYENPHEIQEELKKFGFADPKIKVFGRNDLADIGNKIVAWVNEVERRVKNS